MAKNRYPASELRRIAESADGLRGKALALVAGKGGKLKLVEEGEPGFDESPIKVHTPFSRNAGMKSKADSAEVTIRYKGKPVTIKTEFDAVFTNQSSVEKFVTPYYSRLLTPAKLTARMAELLAEEVIGVLHAPTSEGGTVSAPADAAGMVGLRANKKGGVDFI